MSKRAPAWACLLIGVSCGNQGGAPITFEEVAPPRVPMLAQIMYPSDIGFNAGLGAAVADVDGDGRQDVYLASGGLYLNRPDPQGFRLEPAPQLTPPPELALLGVAFGDYDRDGDADLALCGEGGARLWANDAGQFVDVTAAAGVGGSLQDISLSAAWGDLDGDGWLDLVVANYGLFGTAVDEQPSHLYMNRRDGTFVRLGDPLDGLPVRAWVAAFLDADGDGRLDLYVGDDADVPFLDVSRPRHDLLLLNRGTSAAGLPVLVESSVALGLATPRATMGLAVGNAKLGPGWDLLIADISASWLFRADAAGEPFRDVTAASRIDLSSPPDEQWWQWGSAFADLDGDGFEDALVSQSQVLPGQAGVDFTGPVLLRNRGGEFDLVRDAFGGSMHARAIVLVDLDADGDDDAIVAPFFDRFRFFENTSPLRRWLRVRLVATVGAPGAAGAVVVARAGELEMKRMVVAGGQPHSGSEEVLDFGLAGASRADLTVTWPSGAVQKVLAVPADSRVVITEPRWLEISDPRPPADGTTRVGITVDVVAAGLGVPGTRVRWESEGTALEVISDAAGLALFELPPRDTPGPIVGTVSIGIRELAIHPALDYQ